MLNIFFAKTKNPKGGNPRSNYIVVAGKIRYNEPNKNNLLVLVFVLPLISTISRTVFVVRAMRVYPMSLRPGRLYSYALKPVQI